MQKKHSVNIIGLFLFAVMLSLAAIFFTATTASAATAQELQLKIEEQRLLIQDLDKKILEYSALTDKTSKEAKSLNDVINGLKASQKALELDISKTSAKIKKADLDIQDLDIKIDVSAEQISNYKKAIETSINEINQKGDSNIITIFLSERSLSSVLNEIDAQTQFNKKISDSIDKLDKEKKNLEVTQSTRIATKEDLQELQKELSDKKKVIEFNKAEQSKALKETENKKRTYQQILADEVAKKEAFEKDLFEYESQLKYTLDPSTIPASGSKVFSWPLDSVRVTQQFGKTSASGRLYASGSHNGMDFGAKLGTAAKATAAGVVMGVGDTDITCPRASFGKWVFIKYDNGLSMTYGHLSVISAAQGQRVKAGDIIGYTGSTGYSTGPHLHISVYASDAVSVQQRASASCSGKIYTMPIAPVDAYLDPMVYFPKI